MSCFLKRCGQLFIFKRAEKVFRNSKPNMRSVQQTRFDIFFFLCGTSIATKIVADRNEFFFICNFTTNFVKLPPLHIQYNFLSLIFC